MPIRNTLVSTEVERRGFSFHRPRRSEARLAHDGRVELNPTVNGLEQLFTNSLQAGSVTHLGNSWARSHYTATDRPALKYDLRPFAFREISCDTVVATARSKARLYNQPTQSATSRREEERLRPSEQFQRTISQFSGCAASAPLITEKNKLAAICPAPSRRRNPGGVGTLVVTSPISTKERSSDSGDGGSTIRESDSHAGSHAGSWRSSWSMSGRESWAN